MNNVKQTKLLNKNLQQEEKIKDFIELLESIDDVEVKQKSLWRTIFVHAMEDRERAQALYDSSAELVDNEPNNHALVGNVLAKYLERMTMANAQILELAKIVQKSMETIADASKFDVDNVFNQINK